MKKCAIWDCDRPNHARGWCTLHYGRWRRTGNPKTVWPELWQRKIARIPIEALDPPRRAAARAGQRRFDKLLAERIGNAAP